MNEKEAQNWAGFIHLSTLLGYIIPFGSLIAPAVLWGMKRSNSELVDRNGKEALNFQLSMYIYLVIITVGFIALIKSGVYLQSTNNHNLLSLNVGLFYILIGVLCVGVLIPTILAIIAGIKAFNGEIYRYPLCIRFIR